MSALTASPTANPVVQQILALQLAILGFIQAAALLNYSKDAAYVARKRGTFPVRVRKLGGQLVVFTSDLIEFLETGESQASQSVPLIRKVNKAKTGRPSKNEALAAASANLSVREYRAQMKIGGL